MKIRLLIIDYDTDFRRKFSNYIAAHCSRISITVMGSEIQGEDAAALAGSFDLIVCDEDAGTFFSGVSGPVTEKIIYLSHGEKEGMPDGRRTVNKFQRMPGLLAGIPEISSSAEVMDTGKGLSGEGKLIYVTGFSGGCGRTAFSLALARAYRRLCGGKVLVLSTAQFSDLYDYFPVQEGNENYHINMLILSCSCGNVPEMQRYLIRDSSGVCAFAVPENIISDISELTEDELDDFISCIQNQHLFDWIIIDGGRADVRKNNAALKKSETVFILSDMRRTRHFAENRWLAEMFRNTGTEKINVVESFSEYAAEDSRIYIPDEVSTGKNGFVLHYDPDSFFERDGLSDISMSGRYAAEVMAAAKEVMCR